MDVFISYSSKEFDKACLVKNTLAKNGISTWMAPDSIPGGSNYTKEIPSAIKACKVFLLILSENAQKSIWVSAETEQAFKHEKLILPFVIDKCEIADEFDFMLSRSQRIDAYEQKADALEKLVTRLKTLLGDSLNFLPPGIECSTWGHNYHGSIRVDDIFTLQGRGQVIVGHVLFGRISDGDNIMIQDTTASVLALERDGLILSGADAKNGRVGILINSFTAKVDKGDTIYALRKA